jgi:hypothetical protein
VNRRDLFRLVLGALAVGPLKRFLPTSEPIKDTTYTRRIQGLVGEITEYPVRPEWLNTSTPLRVTWDRVPDAIGYKIHLGKDTWVEVISEGEGDR